MSLRRGKAAGRKGRRQYLDRLVDEGFIERVDNRYKLSATGAREGELEFVASFEGLIKLSECQCSSECWCNRSPDEGQVIE